MAATRLIALLVNKGKTIARCLADRTDYSENAAKTMAANMIGVKKNIIVVSIGFMQVAMVNAKIVNHKKPYQTEEGCLSFMGGPVKTTRYEEIEVEYLDMNFKPKKDKFTRFTAQIIQHELDHVEGRLI